jgi:hypothetical protein
MGDIGEHLCLHFLNEEGALILPCVIVLFVTLYLSLSSNLFVFYALPPIILHLQLFTLPPE